MFFFVARPNFKRDKRAKKREDSSKRNLLFELSPNQFGRNFKFKIKFSLL